jgi:hypothetical protein
MSREVAPGLGVTLQEAKVGAAEDLTAELAAVEKEQPDALFVYPATASIIENPAPMQMRGPAPKGK